MRRGGKNEGRREGKRRGSFAKATSIYLQLDSCSHNATLDTDGGLVERSSMRSGWQRAQYRARVLGRAAVAAGRPSR